MITERKKNIRHSLEKKLNLITRYESGESIKLLTKEYQVYPTLLKEWLRQYRARGVAGLCMKNSRYSIEFKQKVVTILLEEKLSLHQASTDYLVTRSVLQKWVKKAKTLGMDSLAVDGRGKLSKEHMGTSKKNKTKPISTEEELLHENEYLKAENEYLKKLKALVEERIAREKGNAPKSSSN